MKSITEIFLQFCKERHKEDKGRNFNLLQEVYSQAEFFDLSLHEVESYGFPNSMKSGNSYKVPFVGENFSMPFNVLFVKIWDTTYFFLREYSPDIITGTVYTILSETTLNIPVIIRLGENPTIAVELPNRLPAKEVEPKIWEQLALSNCSIVQSACLILNNLSKKEILVDKPLNPNAKEYYARKKAPAIKIPQRPIYYVLEKNEAPARTKNIKVTGTLEYSHAFKIRGHWRRISEKSIGKDRNGNYCITGFTWVTEYVKGEGELVKRLHVIK